MEEQQNRMPVDPTSLPYRPCVGIFLTNKDNLVFSAERLDTPGAWQMPQGGIDPDEDALSAAYRELKEETSIAENHVTYVRETSDWLTYDLPRDLAGKAFKGNYRGQKQKWFHFAFTADDSVIDLATGHQEFREWKWSTPAEILSEIVDFKKGLYQSVLAELNR